MKHRTLRPFAMVVSVLCFSLCPFACEDAVINTASTGSSTSASASTTGAGGHASSSSSASSNSASATSTSSSTSTGMPCDPSDPSCHPPLLCATHGPYQCGDRIDNDGDNVIDMDDPDCTGPCDNSEDSLYSDNPGQASPCKLDCYFGTPANHTCVWDHACDPNEMAPNYAPESNHGTLCAYDPTKIVNPSGKTCAELSTTQSAQCVSYCQPLTPNGCDCFGCCELPAGTGKFVWLGSTNPQLQHCTMQMLGDPSVCQPCTPVLGCINPCAPCKVCIGKPTVDPLTCPNGQECEVGAEQCGQPGQAQCPAGKFCKTGCCYPVPAI